MTTAFMCPQGCGSIVSTNDLWCPGCRRPLNATGAVNVQGDPESDACLEWFGPDHHRMRCRKAPGHSGVHSCENDCGEQRGDGWICGKPDGHEGAHWSE